MDQTAACTHALIILYVAWIQKNSAIRAIVHLSNLAGVQLQLNSGLDLACKELPLSYSFQKNSPSRQRVDFQLSDYYAGRGSGGGGGQSLICH